MVFHALINAKVTWNAIGPETIKCFRQMGIKEYQLEPESPPPFQNDINEDSDFAKYFEELLDIPWDEYLSMDDELQKKCPAKAPDAQAYSSDESGAFDEVQQHTEDRPYKAGLTVVPLTEYGMGSLTLHSKE